MVEFFGFIAQPMTVALRYLADTLGNAGLSIIIFTVAIKLVLLPLNLQQTRSAKAMQELQPKIQELQKKHKNDKPKLTEETMALYKEHKINPAAGCITMIPQIIVLYGLYGAFRNLGEQDLPTH